MLIDAVAQAMDRLDINGQGVTPGIALDDEAAKLTINLVDSTIGDILELARETLLALDDKSADRYHSKSARNVEQALFWLDPKARTRGRGGIQGEYTR